jgi:hypothetical protein
MRNVALILLLVCTACANSHYESIKYCQDKMGDQEPNTWTGAFGTPGLIANMQTDEWQAYSDKFNACTADYRANHL